MGDNPDQRSSFEHSIDQQSTSEIETKIDVEDLEEHNANENRSDSSPIRKYNSLYRAALEGDWQSANKEYKKNPTILELPITQQQMNVLQVAIAAKQNAFVKELLNLNNAAKQSEFVNSNRDTALAITALSGNVEIAKKIVTINENLPMIRNDQDLLPLFIAAMHKQRDMVSYLYSVTEFGQLKDGEKIKLLLHVISCDLYDIAKEILKKDRSLAIAKDKNDGTALEQLAKKPFAIGSRSQMSPWKRWMGYCYC